ncbi:hypothetical protein [uncultured Pseudoflavonifractor sp.]|uniref:hypothetical protein n=1 Tax=uncultured Pseudoflavonifractor sp. TaxID=1221379 RepID=UPI0025DD07FA|nr:hypothetical protein [uncultured Pseudoflavonifractor sp.]
MKKLVLGGSCAVSGILLTVLMEAGALAQAGMWAVPAALVLMAAGLLLGILGLREQ